MGGFERGRRDILSLTKYPTAPMTVWGSCVSIPVVSRVWHLLGRAVTGAEERTEETDTDGLGDLDEFAAVG